MMKNLNLIDNEAGIQKSVGEKIRELRKSAKMNSTALSGLAGISQGQLSKIENGKTTISIKTLSKLCRIFNRPLSYLFQEQEELPHVLGTLNIADGPEKEGFKWFAAEVKRTTQNRISLVLLEAYQGGMASSQAEFLQQGIIDLFIEDLDHLHRFVSETNIFSLPYAFSSITHELNFLKGDFFNSIILEPLRKHGIRFINPEWNWFRGARRVLVSKVPIFSPRDIKGLKVRIFDSKILDRYWRDIGAVPVFVPWADVKYALNRGHIDVLPTHNALVYSLGFCETAKYVTKVGEIPSILGVAMNEAKYQLLSPKHQEAIRAACFKAGSRFSNFVSKMDDKNEKLAMAHFKAVYINTGPAPWKDKLNLTRERLMEAGILSREVWDEVQKARPKR